MNGDPRNPEFQPSDTPADLEQDLRADLAAIGAAWSALERDQPPVLLDQAVLNAARRAVAEPGHPARRPWRWPFRWPFRWLGAFATAAVIVLAVAVVLKQDREAPAPPPAGNGYELPPSAPAAEVSQRMTAPAAAAPSAPAPAADMEQDFSAPGSAASPPSPEEWIERLRNLRTAGDPAAFEAQLAVFRATYPAYPLPPDLLE